MSRIRFHNDTKRELGLVIEPNPDSYEVAAGDTIYIAGVASADDGAVEFSMHDEGSQLLLSFDSAGDHAVYKNGKRIEPRKN